MSAPIVRVDYDGLTRVASAFTQEAHTVRTMARSLGAQLTALRGGDWIGPGATHFYSEMDGSVLPSIERLIMALNEASRTGLRIVSIIREAEDAAAAVLRGVGAGGGAGPSGGGTGVQPGGGTPAKIAGGGPLDDIKKFFDDVWNWLTGGGGAPSVPASPPAGSGPVTAEQADAIFKDMANEPDIAFNYPKDGCYARAHIMAKRIAERHGTDASKAWAFGRLSVPTSTPYGTVTWRYHVAPTVQVRQPDGSIVPMVIDPSIAGTPLTVGQWRDLMHDPNANMQVTPIGQPPTNPATGRRFPGSGYWPSDDPAQGVDQEAATRMEDFLRRGKLGLP